MYAGTAQKRSHSKGYCDEICFSLIVAVAFAVPYLEILDKESEMSYKSAANVLPAELVKEIQKYVDGEYLYIPSRARKSWGSRNGAKEMFAERDAALFREYENGAGMEALSVKYCLSIKGIEKILISQRKKEKRRGGLR